LIPLAIVAVAVAVVVLAVLVVRRRRHPDGVAQFRRQIDALSPEARRPVVDRVQQLEDEAGSPAQPRRRAADDEA
jgi:hypothetical protein